MSSGVKKLAQVVVGAVIGFVQGGPVGAVVGAGLAFYAAEQQEKLNTKSSMRDNEPSAQTVRSSKAPVRFILGRVSTGGVLVWAQEQSGAQADGEWLHLVYVLCEGAIDGLEAIYLGEEEISSFGAYATYELVVNPTEVNAFLKANCADWKDTQIGRGLSYVRLSLFYSAVKFPSGIPDVRFVVRGRNDIFDPRTGSNVYTGNTALHMLWYLRTRCGVPDDEIVFETFASAANVCDETITNADGSVSQRYRSACVIGADEQRTNVMQRFEAACAGKLIRVGGRWMLQAGAYYGPYDFEITEDMIVGTITGNTEPTNDAAINTVRGTFIDPSQSWTETDYPEVSVAQWVAEDGGEAAETLTFSYVTDPYQAQRLANIELRRRRAAGALNLPMNFQGYNCRPGRAVRVNLPSLNILGEFIVTNWSMATAEGCSVSVAQYDAAQFDDAVGQPYNPIGFINLPTGGLGSPTNLSWTSKDTAEVVQGVLAWTPPTGIVSSYAVVVRQGSAAVQSHSVPAESTQCAINGLPSGSYTMSVSAIGPMARSGEVSINVSINGPPIPESCVVMSSIDSIVLVPQNPTLSLNGGTYEYFFSTSPNATAKTADYLGQGLSFTHTGLAFYTNYYYFIRSSNAYGKSAFLYVPASTSNDVSAYLAALAGKITKSELGQELLSDIEKIDDLQDQIDALDGLSAYKGDQTYLSGQMVVGGGRIYQATQNVPINTPPPNIAYWLDVGQVVQTANGLAQQVASNTADITELDGAVTAQASSVQALRASVRDDNGEGELADALKGWSSTASIVTESQVRATETEATAKIVTQLTATVGDNVAQVTDLRQVVSTVQSSTATAISQLGVKVDGNTLNIQTQSQAVADVSGKVSGSWSVKMQYNPANGQYIAAGIGLGLENTGAGLQSQFLVSADRFAIVNSVAGGAISVPFAVQNGQVFINAAFIQDGTITNAKIGSYISSTNYVAGQSGWILNKDGTFEINSALGGGGRQVINSAGGKVFDQNGVKRYQWGNLDA
ncbi:phage tail tip fiber protein [Pseudomonas sp. PS02290]|uniref:phage tail tip fiber protein n=1 Tax=Pseudomonas sp. PS02290 TaxID=2991430 RepID=UPI00249BE895|nr:phage tail protein [Pseudomonas sp. PS02290]